MHRDSNGQLGLLRINHWPVWDLLGYPEATLRLQVQLSANINLNLSISQPYFVFQISKPPNIILKWFCIQNLQIDLRFQEKRMVCKSIIWFTSYSNCIDPGEFRCFSLNALYLLPHFTSQMQATVMILIIWENILLLVLNTEGPLRDSQFLRYLKTISSISWESY